jgi:hypothetical protein
VNASTLSGFNGSEAKHPGGLAFAEPESDFLGEEGSRNAGRSQLEITVACRHLADLGWAKQLDDNYGSNQRDAKNRAALRQAA